MARARQVALIYDATLPYDVKVIEGVAAYVHEVGNWNVYIEECALKDQRLPEMRTWRGDGVFANFDDPKVAAAVAEAKIPVVGFGGGYGCYDPDSEIPSFATDNRAIARLAAEHLLDRGFRQFAYCGYPRTRINGWSEERADEFRRQVEQAGFDCRVYKGRHKTARRWAELQRTLREWLDSLPKPLGLMACNDKRARHVLEACYTLGVRVPEEVAVIGVDNDQMLCQLASPPLTSVRQGARRLGYEAAALLDQMMSGSKPAQQNYVIQPRGVISRRSTDILAVEDPDVAAAIRFVREQVGRGIKVADVVDAVGLSRSTLEARFAALMGRSVHTEIRRMQIQQAAELVSTTDLPLKQVARQTGFTSVQHMTTVFHRHIGQPPAAYRKRSGI